MFLKRDVNFEEVDEKDAREFLKSHVGKLTATLVQGSVWLSFEEDGVMTTLRGAQSNHRWHICTVTKYVGHTNIMLTNNLTCVS